MSRLASTDEFKQRLKARIQRNVDVHALTGCWIWTGTKNNGGYPIFNIWLAALGKGKRFYVHRVSYEIFKKQPRKYGEVAHSHRCVSQLCVNPDHLRKTSRSANERDKKRAANWKRLNLRELPTPSTHVLAKQKREKQPCTQCDDLEVPF